MAATFVSGAGSGSGYSRIMPAEEEGKQAIEKLASGYTPPPVAPPPTSFYQPPKPAAPNPLDKYGEIGPNGDPIQQNNTQPPPPPPPPGTALAGPQPGVIGAGGVTDIAAPANQGPGGYLDKYGNPVDYFTGVRYRDSGGTEQNQWRTAEAASQYGLHEALNPALAAQEGNLGTIATAAGDYARAQGDSTQAQGGAVAGATDAIAQELLANQAGRNLAPIDVISGDAAKQQASTLNRLRGYDASPGTSAAERSIAQQSNRDFANSLALARSGGTASERAWGERAAVAQNFERNAESGRTLATMRADEQERAKARELSALGAEAGVAGGVDSTRLGAGTAQAETDLALQQLQDSYTLNSQQLGVDTLLQGQTLGLQAGQQGFNQSLMGYQLPYQAQQDIISQGNFQQQLGAQNYGLASGIAVQGQQREDAQNALPWQIGAGVVGSVGGGLMALSDERAKTAIGRLRAEAAEAVEQSPGYSYKYKPGEGEDDELYAGPMAQDLERTKFGKSLVVNGPDGRKRVRVDRLALHDHAALGNALERLRKLEEAA
jgi:hypothetical protein